MTIQTVHATGYVHIISVSSLMTVCRNRGAQCRQAGISKHEWRTAGSWATLAGSSVNGQGYVCLRGGQETAAGQGRGRAGGQACGQGARQQTGERAGRWRAGNQAGGQAGGQPGWQAGGRAGRQVVGQAPMLMGRGGQVAGRAAKRQAGHRAGKQAGRPATGLRAGGPASGQTPGAGTWRRHTS